MRSLTNEQLDTLRHMLGVNDPVVARAVPWRDYAAVTPGDAHFALLEQQGMVHLTARASSAFPYDYYACTSAGREAALASARAMRWSKPKRVYVRFLELRDVFADLTFKTFLTDSRFNQVRRDA